MTALVGLVVYAVARFPFVLFAVTAAVAVSTQDAAVVGSVEAITPRAWASIGTGGGLVLAALLVDTAGGRRAAFWPHVVGLFAVAVGLASFAVEQDEGGAWLAILLLGAAVLLLAPVLRRATWAAYGVLAVYAGAIHYLDDALPDSTLGLALVGVSVVLVGFGLLVARRG